MRVLINGETKEVPGEIGLRDLLEHFDLPTQRVAVELNDAVVRRKDWGTTTVNDKDKIEIVHFVGGG